MRLVVSAAVLALWMTESSNNADAFSMHGMKSRYSSYSKQSSDHSSSTNVGQFLSITTMPSSPRLYMSTIERPMTAPGSPNSPSYNGHPFGSYGKPDNSGADESNYSYGPSSPNSNSPSSGPTDSNIAANNSNHHDNQYSRNAPSPASSFEAYMQGRNNKSNPSSPSDNYDSRQQSNNNGFGAPSTPASAPTSPSNNNNNDSNSFASFVTSAGAGNTGESSSTNNNNSFANFATSGSSSTNNNNNFGAPSTPPPAAQNANSYSPPPANNISSSSSNFGAPPATTNSAPGSNNNNSFSSFAAGANSSSPPLAPTQPSSFEAYMNSRGSNSSDNNNSSSPSFAGSSNNIDNSSISENLNSRMAAAVDPNAPLPPYMSPSSLENGNVRSANLSGSSDADNANPSRPAFRPPHISGNGMEMGSQPQRSASSTANTNNAPAPTTSFQQQGPQIAPPLSAPLARVGVPNQQLQLDIGLPSEELVGRLDQVLTQQQVFADRLDRVDEKIDKTTQENIQRTQTMLNSFKEENKKTQETFMNRINGDIRGMRTTMDRVLDEQRDLKQKQEGQTAKFVHLEKARSDQAQSLLNLEKTTSVRAQNMEQNLSLASQNQAQRLDTLERNTAQAANRGPGGAGNGPNTLELERRQNERMTNFERSQVERMAAFEEEQRQQLENSLREYQQQQQSSSSSNSSNNNGNSMNASSPDYSNKPQRPMDDTERQLQQRLNDAQARKEELLEQLRDMQRQEELHMKGGPGSHEDPHSPPGRRGGIPPPPPFASPLDAQQTNANANQYQNQQQGVGRDEFDQFEEDDNDEEMEEEPPRRGMLRDRLGKSSGEQRYSRNVGGGNANTRRNLNEEESDYDGESDMRMDPEEERRFQHERMMRRDPVSPPEAMGPQSSRRPGSPAGRYDPRRGGPFGREEDELAYDISNDSNSNSSVQKTLSNMQSFKGDEPLPKSSIFNEAGNIGGMGSTVGGQQQQRRSQQPQQSRRVPAQQGPRGAQQQQQQQQPRRPGAPQERRAGLSEPPPPNPMVDKKIEHFLMETLKGGPQPHFDKELESLLIIKYSPLFSWLKPGNVSFLRNVLITFLQHKGCQVEMDIRSAPPKAAREWDELLNILSFELEQRTGEKPRIMEEPDNQWGIYGSKNVTLRITGTNPKQQKEQQRRRGGGLTPEEAARRKMRNEKAFRVNQDPTDPTTRLL